jgi:hypothetical protein
MFSLVPHDKLIPAFQLGKAALSCNLNYDDLLASEFVRRIQKCVDSGKDKTENDWVFVVNWDRACVLVISKRDDKG